VPTALDLAAIADRLMATARPGEEIEVVVGTSTSTSVRAYGGDVEALTVADSSGIGVRVIIDGRLGFASAGSLEADVVDEVLAEARDNVPFAVADQHVTLAEPDGVAQIQNDLWDTTVATTSLDDKVAMAIELERMVTSADPRIAGVRSSSYGDQSSMSLIASTTGIRAASRATAASVGVLALARDGDETQSGGGSSVARGPADLDLDEAAEDAVERATALLGAVQPTSRSISLVLEPPLAASLLGIIGGMLSGERVLKGRTPFADRVGEAIAVGGLTLTDDPNNPESYGAKVFDGEGLAARRNPLIAGGILEGFLHNSMSASRAGSTSTASAVRGIRSTPGVGWHALHVEPGTRTLEELIAGVDDGLLLHSMTGLHSGVNAVSGDFSVGASGIAICNGELDHPVREVTIASTLPKLLQDIVGIGSDLEHLPGGVSTPSLCIANAAMSGK
jgi:PmbA protein